MPRLIAGWQKRSHFSDEVEWVGEMIQEDARRCLGTRREGQTRWRAKIAAACREFQDRQDFTIGSGVWCGVHSSELAGEIGTIERFSKEGSLALYLGMATLDNRSGKYQGTKAPKQVNTRAKAAMMIGVDRHRKRVAQSQRYYEKKRSRGKEAQPSDSSSRTTLDTNHLQAAQGRTRVRDSPRKREYQDQGRSDSVR